MFYPYAVLAGVYLPLVSASIYPTQPVQATVWSADQPMLVNWIEDRKYPQLSEMGLVDISLWCDTDTYLAPLASGVDPTTKTHQVTVPGSVLKKGSKYTLRFTTSEPIDTVVFSGDFAIIPANTTAGSITGTSTGSGDGALAMQNGTETGTGTATTTTSGFRTVPTTAGSSSSSWTTTMVSATALPTDQTTTSSGVGTIPGGGAPGQGQRQTNAGRRGMDVEKLKFRFVFVIWPVLMGITMAL